MVVLIFVANFVVVIGFGVLDFSFPISGFIVIYELWVILFIRLRLLVRGYIRIR